MGVNTVLEKTDNISDVLGLYIGANQFATFTRESNMYHKKIIKLKIVCKKLSGHM
jgi:hypothetical protein